MVVELDYKVTNLSTINLNYKVMEAKDLMIGCLYRVKKDVCLPKGTIVIIRGIDADNRFPEKHLVGSATCLPINSEYVFTYGVWVEYLEPIPITPEILEKNGFERSKVFVEWKYENDNVYIIYKPFPYLKIQMEECIVAFPCEYIHQLQQALRLCKIEKEIIL